MEHLLSMNQLEAYKEYLYEEEKSVATIEKYMRDLRKLMDFAAGRELNKAVMVEYKNHLKNQNYQISSINSFLAAVNQFFAFLGWHELRVKAYKVQREAFAPENSCLTREEYRRLVDTAEVRGKVRLSMILQTICATGIRISELSFITTAAVKRGELNIQCKGKNRKVLFSTSLQKMLGRYIKTHHIQGTVFVTSTGRPVNRSNVWKEMKQLCRDAKVSKEKVYPHNLRHLFAQAFYEIKKDIAKLADVLGHSSIETTRIYIKTPSREHRRQLERMHLVLRP